MAMVKVQTIYQLALDILGKTEAGTDYPFRDRVPALLNTYIYELNLFRGQDEQIAPAETVQSRLDLTDKEVKALGYCLAALAGAEAGLPGYQLQLILDTRNRLMAFATGFEDIGELYLL